MEVSQASELVCSHTLYLLETVLTFGHPHFPTQGQQGSRGKKGPRGPQGKKGVDGDQGDTGADGAPGRGVS